MQDTLKQKNLGVQDSLKHLSDSPGPKTEARLDSVHLPQKVAFQPVISVGNTDTTTSCTRNSIADVTFYDSVNVITQLDKNIIQNFPFVFTEINRKRSIETRTDLEKKLRSGEELPAMPFHFDWALSVMLLSVLFYAVIKSESGKLFGRLLKFVSFRNTNEGSPRDATSLFQWQSTLFNLASFINISLFAFFTSEWYGFFPFPGKGFIFWLIFLAVIVSAFTSRLIICLIIGSVSGEKETFNEYLTEIYQAYRLAGLGLLIITVLIIYTSLLPVKALFYTGFCLIALSYFIRVLRLFLIFINRHVPIFYLILYLCALEILPVVIIVKYITGFA